MSAPIHSTVGQLLYLQRPPLALRQLVTDLDRALAALITPARRLTWPLPASAVFDFEGGRIILSYDPDPCAPWQACLSISVGDGRAPMLGRLGRRHATLARRIIEDVARHHPPDCQRWLDLPLRLSAEMVNDLTAALPQAPETRAALAEAEARYPARLRLPQLDRDLISRTDQQVQSALTAMRRAQEQVEAQFARAAEPPGPLARLWQRWRPARRPARPADYLGSAVAERLPVRIRKDARQAG